MSRGDEVEELIDSLAKHDRVPDHPEIPDVVVGLRVERVDEGVPVTVPDQDMGHYSPCSFLTIDGVPTCPECGRRRLDLDAGEGWT